VLSLYSDCHQVLMDELKQVTPYIFDEEIDYGSLPVDSSDYYMSNNIILTAVAHVFQVHIVLLVLTIDDVIYYEFISNGPDCKTMVIKVHSDTIKLPKNESRLMYIIFKDSHYYSLISGQKFSNI